MSGLKMIALVLFIAVAPTARSAGTTPTTSDEARTWNEMHKMPPMKVFHLIDKDKKGYVTKEELQAFTERLFGLMDKNQDGKVDANEWMGAVNAAKAAKAAQ